MKIGNLEVYGIIYKIENIVNGKIYIGQTINGFDRRYYYKGEDIEKVYRFHKYNKNKNKSYNKHLFNSIERYGFKKFTVIKIFDIAFSKEELDIKEKLWIETYNSMDSNFGYNNKEGGDTARCTEETKKRMSESKKGCNAMNKRKVVCINNELIFDSATEASEYSESLTTSIIRCCKRKSNFSGTKSGIRLIWLYYEDYKKLSIDEINRLKNNPKRFTQIICITLNEIFNSVDEASKKYGCKNSNIINCCKNIIKSAGHLHNGEKLIWKYYDGELNEPVNF